MKKLWIALLCLALVGVMAACGGGNDDVAPPADNAGEAPADTTDTGAGDTGGAVNETEVMAVYEANCLMCHAADLTGGGGPDLTAVGGRLTAEQIADTINNGRGGMPGFKGNISDEEIQMLTDWLAAKK